MGCINVKIGILNNIFFKDPLDNIYDKNLYNSILSYGLFSLPGEVDGLISENIFNKVISLSETLILK
jgi:hypothetical protein